MFTIREKKEGDQVGSTLVQLSDEELESVDGGEGSVVNLGNGVYEISFSCDACCEHTEHLATLHNDMQAIVPGVYRCPKCGYTKNYEIRPNGGNLGYYIRSWY